MDRRVYCCLSCSDRPVLHGKVPAYLHLRETHADELAERHPDELLQLLPERDWDPEPEELPVDDGEGKHYCLHCDASRADQPSIRQHCEASHDRLKDSCIDGTDFESEKGRRRRIILAAREEAAAVRSYSLALDSIVGVSDFLTECRA